MGTQGYDGQPLDIEHASFNAEPPPPPKVVKFLRSHERFSEIHYDVIESKLRAEQICRRYNLRTKQGNFAINAILRYRKFLDERHGELFAKASEMRQEALREEFLDKHRTNYDLAHDDHQKAMAGKRKNFGAAKSMLDVMAQSASEIGKAVQIGMPQAVPSRVSNTQVRVLMALPKAQPNSQPMRIIEASKTA